MKPFEGLDYLFIDESFSEEERMMRDSVRKWVESEFLPIVNEHHRKETFPVHLAKQMGEMGLFGGTIQGYDCPGLSSVAYGLICQELDRGDAGLRSFCSVQGTLAMYPIYAFGSEEQKQKWLPQLAKGEKFGCFGLTEVDHGSDPASMKTRARKDGDSYIINGSKMWITNGSLADVAVIWARDEDTKKMSGFLVEKGTPGFTSRDIKGKFSMRASITSELGLDNVRVPAANKLPGADSMKAPLSTLSQARYGISWGAIGAAMACYHTALEYAKERVQFDRPIAGYQLVQNKLVWMLNEITKAQLLALQVGRIKDQGKWRPQHISMAKRNNVWMALECARKARDIMGAAGIVDDHPVIRHLLNMETVYTYEGTHDIHTLVLGHDITGLPAYSG